MNWPLGTKQTATIFVVALASIWLVNYTGIARRVIG